MTRITAIIEVPEGQGQWDDEYGPFTLLTWTDGLLDADAKRQGIRVVKATKRTLDTRGTI